MVIIVIVGIVVALKEAITSANRKGGFLSGCLVIANWVIKSKRKWC